MALIKAARNFDPENGAEFLSYAVVTMKGEVKRQFRDFGWMVRPPRPIQKMQADVSRAEGELTQTLGRSPRVPEVAAHLGVSEDEVLEALAADGCYTPTSLDTPVGEQGDAVLGDDEAPVAAIVADPDGNDVGLMSPIDEPRRTWPPTSRGSGTSTSTRPGEATITSTSTSR